MDRIDKCTNCSAVVNPRWQKCIVCGLPLDVEILSESPTITAEDVETESKEPRCSREVKDAENEHRSVKMTMKKPHYQLVNNEEDLETALNPLMGSTLLAIDTETTGLDPLTHKIRLIQLAGNGISPVIVDLWSLDEADNQPLKELLSNSSVKLFHNAKFDIKMLMQAGLSVGGDLFDTMLAAQLLDAGLKRKGHTLSDLTECYLGITLPKELQKSDWSKSLTDEQLEYAARDVEVLMGLYEVLLSKLEEADLHSIAKLEFECLPAIAAMELTGMKIDQEKWKNISQELQSLKDQRETVLRESLGQEVNLNSPKQLLEAFKTHKIPVNSTSKDALEPLVHNYPIVNALLEYKKTATLVQNFTNKLPAFIHPVTGRIHSEYHQLGAVTGRFSCSKPNMQQIPRDKTFRECFVAEPNCKLVIGDYNQVELRIAAEISKDSRMIKAYQKGGDLHKFTASLMARKSLEEVKPEERQAAKAVNFGLIYAMGAEGLQMYAKSTYGIRLTLEQAAQFRQKFFRAYQGIAKWHRGIQQNIPMETRTIGGRRRKWKVYPRSSELFNTPVQGSAADILKKALSKLFIALQPTGAKIVACVHDEIIIEAPEARSEEATHILKEVMVQAGEDYLKQVPVVVDLVVTDSWAGK